MSILRRISNLLSRPKLRQEIDAELRSHVEMRIEDNIAAGMSPGEARQPHVDQRARHRRGRQLGSGEPCVRDSLWTAPTAPLARLCVDRYLDASRGWSAQIGSSSVCSTHCFCAHSMWPGQTGWSRSCRRPRVTIRSYPDYLDYRARNTTFSDIAAYRLTMAGKSIGGAAEKCWNYEVSGNYFDMLGVEPQALSNSGCWLQPFRLR